MRLLVLTQVLDRRDGVLGFFARWIAELAAGCERVRVVALEVGDTSGLPDNVDWVEIGRHGVVGRYLRYRRVLGRSLGPGPDGGFDAVLAHMVPRYALVAAAPARRAGARLYLWYTHKGVDARLRRAAPLARKVFTASEESLRLATPNRVVTGHGIDTEHFDLAAPAFGRPLRILSVGRLTPAKDPLCTLEALALLGERGVDARLDWVGGGLTKDDVGFAREVGERVRDLGLTECVTFHGEVPYSEVDRAFGACDLLVNASHTGSVDKVVLEAMAARRPVVTCNESFPPIFAGLPAPFGGSDLCFEHGDAAGLAARVGALAARPVKELVELGEALRRLVVRDHGVAALCARLVAEMDEGGGA